MSTGGYSQMFKSASADNLSQINYDENELSKHSKVKRLSLETNRRRRELATRLKKEAEKEEKRKQEILEQRREKQRQATEKFQRSFSARSKKSPGRPRSPGRATGELDAMLHLVRTGAPLHRVASWDSVRHHAWPSAADAADPWLNGVPADAPAPRGAERPPRPPRRSAFEQQLARRQERLAMDGCRSLAAFSSEVDACVAEPAPADSLDDPPAPPAPPPAPPEPPTLPVEPGVAALLDDAMFRPTAPNPSPERPPVEHFRFVVDGEAEAEAAMEEETTVEDLESSAGDAPSVKGILKKRSAYCPDDRRGVVGRAMGVTAGRAPAPAANGLPSASLRDSIEIARVHMEQRSPPESPQPARRKSVRFAERLCEDLAERTPSSISQALAQPEERVIYQPLFAHLRRYSEGAGESPSPKPRRVYGTYGSVVSSPTDYNINNSSGGARGPPTAATRLTVTRRAAKPPQYPGASSPGRRPERVTSATLSRLAAAASGRDPAPAATQDTQQGQSATAETAPVSPARPVGVVTVIPSANQPTLVISTPPPPSPEAEDSPAAAPAPPTPSGEPTRPQLQPQQNGTHAPPPTTQADASDTFPLDKTPTESDIEWLWAKVRSCLQRPGSGAASVAGSVGGDSQTASELSIQSAPARAVVPMSSQVIDGTSIYPPNLARHPYRISRHDAASGRLVHHNVSPHARRVALIRQREMNQHLHRAGGLASAGESPHVSGGDNPVTDSMAEFLANEQLCQQSHLFTSTAPAVSSPSPSGSQGLLNPVMDSMFPQQEVADVRRGNGVQVGAPPSGQRQPSATSNFSARRRVFLREQYKPHSLQQYPPGSYTLSPHPPDPRKTSAGPNGGKRLHSTNGYRPTSTLSIEEQRLMKSLERINDKLKTTTFTK